MAEAGATGVPGSDVVERGAASEAQDVDVVVVGAGPAGVAAATRAAEVGRQVVVVDAGPRPGGQIWRHTTREALPAPARRWLDRLDRSGARVLCGHAVVDATADRVLTLVDGDGGTVRLRARRLVLATGARERFLPFPGWTLPGVVGVGGAQALLKAGARVDGLRVVVAGSGPLLLPVAAALADAGAHVAHVVEQASRRRVLGFGIGLWSTPRRIRDAARYRLAFRSAPYRLGTWVASAEGGERVRRVTLTNGRRRWTEACDLLAVGYGLVPALELPRWIGCALSNGTVRVDGRQRTSVPDVFCAGEPTGIAGMEAALVEGEIAGLCAAAREDLARERFSARDRERRFVAQLERAFALRPELRSLPQNDTIICRCEDVRLGQIRAGWSLRQAKLMTRAGMGPCQGRVCSAGMRFLFDHTDQPTPRPPLWPAPVDALGRPPAAAGESRPHA